MRTKLTIAALALLIILWACLMGTVIEVGENVEWKNSIVQKMHIVPITEEIR